MAKHAVHQILSGAAAGDGGCPAAEIVFQDGGYTLRVPDLWLDIGEFERLCDEGRQAAARNDRPTALDRYRRAQQLYTGDFLYGETAEWVREHQEWGRSLALAGLGRLLEDALCREDMSEALTLCRRTLQVDPYQENVYRTLIELHGELGQLGQARAWYEQCCHRLSEGLDLGITEATRRVFERAMRAGEESSLRGTCLPAAPARRPAVAARQVGRPGLWPAAVRITAS